MYKKYSYDLEKWNSASKRKPLFLIGVSKVGKTYLIKENVTLPLIE